MHVCMYAFFQVFMYLSMSLCEYASMRVCRYASMHLCTYASMYAIMQEFKNACIHICVYSSIQVCNKQSLLCQFVSKQTCASVQVCRMHISIQVSLYISLQVSSIQLCNDANTQLCKCKDAIMQASKLTSMRVQYIHMNSLQKLGHFLSRCSSCNIM